MEEQIKLELERAKLANYVLKKENEILLGTIGILTREKEQMIIDIEKNKQKLGCKLTRKLKNGVKKIIRGK